MDKIKRVVNAVLPVSVCNLRCHYCFLGREDRLEHSPIDPLKYSNEYIAKALRKERMGGNCLIVLCAVGETLLAPDLLDLSTRLIAEGHYIQIVTNGILTGELQKYASLSQETKNHLFFKFSFHYLEFTKRQLLNRFFNNVRLSAAIYVIGLSFNTYNFLFLGTRFEVVINWLVDRFYYNRNAWFCGFYYVAFGYWLSKVNTPKWMNTQKKRTMIIGTTLSGWRLGVSVASIRV